MEEFKKPERITVDAIPYLTEIMGKGLIKDLQEDEVLCPICHGVGLAIDDNVYGLKNDPNKSSWFPYKHQSIISCRNCYNGVLKVCKHCKKPLSRNQYRCECDGAKAERQAEQDKKEQERFDKATKMTFEEYAKKYPNNMVIYGDTYYMDIYDLLDDIYCNTIDGEIINFPKYVWGTNKVKIELDADSFIERTLEDAYEDASFSGQAESELFDFINKWNEKYALECYEENNIAIIIPEELTQDFLGEQ